MHRLIALLILLAGLITDAWLLASTVRLFIDGHWFSAALAAMATVLLLQLMLGFWEGISS